MEKGSLAMVLHAHLPYVGHSAAEDSVERHWLYEAMTESYIPLLLALERLADGGIDYRLTLSMTPTLVSMLNDPLLHSGYEKRLGRLIELAEKEMARTKRQPKLHALASMYRRLLGHTQEAFVNRYGRNLVQAWKALQESGHVEIIASAATHGYLPLLAAVPWAVETQIRVGVEEYRRAFGRRPSGFWLPECGYYPGVDNFLGEQGIRYTVLETHGITRAEPRPRYGVYAPIYASTGVAIFGRDPASTKQVWSPTDGYPGDPDYREFYRDVGYDLDLAYIKPYVERDGTRLDTGLKYYRVTGGSKRKRLYVPEQAERKAELHAQKFAADKEKQVQLLGSSMDRNPIILAAYDAELFGHWWFEGPKWLEQLIFNLATENKGVRMTTLSEYLELFPENPLASPAVSSWGDKGFHESWLNESNDWIYPHLNRAARVMQELTNSGSSVGDLSKRAQAQALRELLLAQSSDWAFMINAGKMAEYGAERTKTHLLRFQSLNDQIQRATIDETWLAKMEDEDGLFPDLEGPMASPHFNQHSRLESVADPEPGAVGATVAGRAPGAAKSESRVRGEVTRLSTADIQLFLAGSHPHLQEKLGAHPMTVEGVKGTYFAVWAPSADKVSVIGDFNGWETTASVLAPHDKSGIWEGFIPDVDKGSRYKFHVISPHHGYRADKADPFAFFNEVSPGTASVVWDLAYRWGDQDWMETRGHHNALNAPISIYEVHLGSWKRRPEEGSRPLTYRELARGLTEYVTSMGFTHVEFMPVMEHPFYGSWGYQVTGYFAPTSRYGTPQDLMYLIDHLHQAGIGVILDWVPSHFPRDEHGLGYFDGTHLYEHQDPRQAIHPEWDSFIFNYGRPEVCSFLISNAEYWLSAYHADGIRVDAVASMLYLDYARQPGEWVPNRLGGRENLEAINFLKRLNEQVRFSHPEVQMIAEESTAWPMVSRPVHVGGLGFGLKWDMGWMHDTLHYMSKDPIHRRHHHKELTFRMLYAFNENFILPLSHDEVVHGKSSLVGRMPGDEWQRYANLRLLFGYMYAQAGKKMLFMGGEFGQVSEWKHDEGLEWDVVAYPTHAGTQLWVKSLNHLYRDEPALHQLDCDPEGFEWVDADDTERSIISFIRRGSSSDDLFLFVGNFTPVPRSEYLVSVPRGGLWRVVLNSDGRQYGGTGFGAVGDIQAMPDTGNGRIHSIKLTLPPLGCLLLKSSASGS